MVSLLIALFFFAVSLGFYVVTRTLKKRHQNWRAFAERRALTFDADAFELSGELMGLGFKVHDQLGIERAAKLGAYMPVGSTAVVVDIPVPGCPAGLLLRSAPPRLAPRRVGSAVEIAAAPASFESAFAAESRGPEDLAALEDEGVRAALSALASTRWYRGVVLEEGTLCAFHFNPAFGSAQDAEELERTVGLALDAAAALREACTARQPRARQRTPQPAKSRRGPSPMKRVG
ncbi:MAG TPA: hypothetical protein VGK67_00535 [Myxococcales bacterium]|jgi:hypothetical protein